MKMLKKFLNGFNSFKIAIKCYHVLFNYEDWLEKHKVPKNAYRMSNEVLKLAFFQSLNGVNILGDNTNNKNKW